MGWMRADVAIAMRGTPCRGEMASRWPAHVLCRPDDRRFRGDRKTLYNHRPAPLPEQFAGRIARGCLLFTLGDLGYNHPSQRDPASAPIQGVILMPSPFPGMDPYLEAEGLWPAFQHQLVRVPVPDPAAGAGRSLPRPRLPAPLPHRAGAVHLRSAARSMPRTTSRSAGAATAGSSRSSSASAPRTRRRPRGGRPTSTKRREGRSQGASVVEIDLVLQGQADARLPARRRCRSATTSSR